MELSAFTDFVYKKCKAREVSFIGPESFFPPNLLDVVEKTWEQWLGTLVTNLPSYKQVIGELQEQVILLLRN